MVTTRGSETVNYCRLIETDCMFPKRKIQKILRATLAREARNRLNYWREAAREARRLTPVTE